MKIEYTYYEPEDRPVSGATFEDSRGDKTWLHIYDVAKIVFNASYTTTVFNKADFADFTALINRINKQIGNE